MASIQIRKETNRLIIDFYYRGQRCREQTALDDTAANRKRLEKLLDRIEFEIKSGTFDYAKFFPGSRMVLKVAMAQAATVGSTAAVAAVTPTMGMATAAMTMLPVAAPVAAVLPTFAEFAAIWVAENEVAWRSSNRRTVADILNGHLLPAFGDQGVGHITKSDTLTFRSTLLTAHRN